MAKWLDFSLNFSLNFSTTHISATHVSEKYLPSQIFSRLTRRYCACFHSTCSTRWPNSSIFTQQQFFCSIFLKRSNFTQHHSTPLDSLNKVAKWLDFFLDFCRVENRVKNRVVWPVPYAIVFQLFLSLL